MIFFIRLFCAFFLVSCFCSMGCSKKEVYEGMYEGINRSQDKEFKDNPGKKQSEPEQPMTYERYQQERKKLLEGEGAVSE